MKGVHVFGGAITDYIVRRKKMTKQVSLLASLLLIVNLLLSSGVALHVKADGSSEDENQAEKKITLSQSFEDGEQGPTVV